CFFFFSSRRRHTRSTRDWSSDVCSSDLAGLIVTAGVADVSANGLVVLAFALIPVGVVASVAGLYPLATMLMARVVLHEAVPRLGMVAIVVAIAGIVLISVGGSTGRRTPSGSAPGSVRPAAAGRGQAKSRTN